MAGLDELWSHFSLTEDEERGADVPRQKAATIHRLAGRFLTKRVLNVDAVARTFKPLWKPSGELKIRDVGEHTLLFEFEDNLDLERVLEYEPWSYDKSLVILQRAQDAESAPFLDFSSATFWIQLHNVPENSLTQETVEAIGKALGTVVQVADPEDDGCGGEFLRVRVTMDVTKPLARCSKLWAEGKHIGWVGIKYERLPNFCYWCGRVTHGERDCAVWLQGRGKLRKEDQQYGEWLRADMVRNTRKSVAVISGASRSQAPWWRKEAARTKKPCSPVEKPAPVQRQDENGSGSATAMDSDEELVEVDSLNVRMPSKHGVACFGQDHEIIRQFSTDQFKKKELARDLENEVVSLKIVDGEVSPHHKGASGHHSTPLANITNVSNTGPTLTPTTKKWKRVERVNEPTDSAPPEPLGDRRPSLDLMDLCGTKKQRVVFCNSDDKENCEVVAGFQHHQSP